MRPPARVMALGKAPRSAGIHAGMARWRSFRGARVGGRVGRPGRRAGSTFEIEVPDPETHELKRLTLSGLAGSLANRMINMFVPDANGYRPIHGDPGSRRAERFAKDPHWNEYLLFYEYFHADSGEGLGANHQTGWTGLVASLIDEWRK